MKKILFGILIFLIPIFVEAKYSITNYKIDITVLENGDINVIEAFSMNGSYNGFEKIVHYKEIYSGYQGSKVSSVEDVKLYDASGIALNEIRSIDFSNDIEEVLSNSNLFIKKNYASKGEYGVYTISKTPNEEIYTIYNPSKMNKDFYLNYTLEDMVIVHDDVAELGINLSNSIIVDIENLEIFIHIPTNNKLLKAWIHGYNGDINQVDSETITIKFSNIKNSTNLDFRVVFDNDIISNSNKKSNQNVLDKIIEIENKILEESNIDKDLEYEKLKEDAYNAVLQVEKTHNKDDYQIAIDFVKKLKEDDLKTDLLVKLINVESKVERKDIITKVVLTSIMGIIIVGLLIIYYQIYKKYNKDYLFGIKEKYLKDIPNDYPPFVVGYLIRRRINNNDLCASILNLINNKSISFEQTKNKKDYKFIKLSCDKLNKTDERLIKFIFDDSDEITLSRINKRAKVDYNNFLNQYSNWLNCANQEAVCEKFYEDLLFIKIFGMSYSIIGIVISTLLLDKSTYFSPIITILICILSFLYFTLFYKRTKNGNEQYYKWLSLKKFMNDFNNMKEKDLPKIDLWDKYLVYSITLGCYDKLSKNMQTKIDKLTNNVSDIVSFQFLINYYKIIDETIKSSIQLAQYSKKSR